MQREWEIWLDTHISPAIAKWMKEYTGFQVKSAYVLDIHTLPDIEIYKKARDNGNVILVSKDTDFPELISRLGAPPKLINVKIGNCDNRSLWELIKPHINDAITLLMSGDIDIIELD